MVFYLKSFANVAEFLTGIFLFVNAVWIFMFESASAIRAIGMTIHAYFNIWCEARKGWKIYSQRKTASMKIMSLADASDGQLAARKDDVCAICYEEMESAKVTLCGHLFHAVCLRKWLYVQNTCPLCHELLYGEDVLEDLNRAQQARAVEEDDEDDIFDNYAAYNDTPSILPPAVVSAHGEGTMEEQIGEAVSPSPSHSASTSFSSSVSESQSRVGRTNLSAGEPSMSALLGSQQSSSRSQPATVVLRDDTNEYLVNNANNEDNVVRNNNNVNFHPNANARSRGGLAVLL
jgi:hypothetical protein